MVKNSHPILDILNRWPSRQAVTDDVNAGQPAGHKIDLVAVHRWHQRKSIPPKYDSALLKGASDRNIPLAWWEIMNARSAHGDQDGHTRADIQVITSGEKQNAVPLSDQAVET